MQDGPQFLAVIYRVVPVPAVEMGQNSEPVSVESSRKEEMQTTDNDTKGVQHSLLPG